MFYNLSTFVRSFVSDVLNVDFVFSFELTAEASRMLKKAHPDVVDIREESILTMFYNAFASFWDCSVSRSGTIWIRNLHFPSVVQQNQQINVDPVFVRS